MRAVHVAMAVCRLFSWIYYCIATLGVENFLCLRFLCFLVSGLQKKESPETRKHKSLRHGEAPTPNIVRQECIQSKSCAADYRVLFEQHHTQGFSGMQPMHLASACKTCQHAFTQSALLVAVLAQAESCHILTYCAS